MTAAQAKKQLRARRSALLGSMQERAAQAEDNQAQEAEDQPDEWLEDELLSALSVGDRDEITRIDAALARIESGDYGVCAECGEDIAPERLAAMPDAVLCISCASAASA